MKLNPIAALLVASMALSGCQQATDAQAPGAKDAAPQDASADIGLETDAEKFSYALGLNLGTRLKSDGMEINTANFASGISHGMGDGTALMTPEQVNQTLMEASERQRREADAARAASAEKNLAAGQAYLDENAKKEGVVTTDSGLQYKVLKAGEGKKPSADDTVSVHYRGTLIDGTEFDSSHKRGQPAEFPVTGVIQGWVEALQLMTVGSTWELTIPADLAYGEAGSPPVIGPSSVLLFEVELLEIK